MPTPDPLGAALERGEDALVGRLVEEELATGRSAAEILSGRLIPAMDRVGARFRDREIFLPHVILAARAMHVALGLLGPRLEGSPELRRGTIVLGTVEGDLHDIGKNLVAIMLRGAGYRVVDLGTGVPAERFVGAAREIGADVVGMSALLTTTAPAMGRVIDLLRQAGLDGVRTLIGGAAVSADFAREIGADGYGSDSGRAVEIARSWLP